MSSKSSPGALGALQSRLDFIGLDAAARQRLSAVTERIQHHIATALDTFYEKVTATPETAREHRRNVADIARSVGADADALRRAVT